MINNRNPSCPGCDASRRSFVIDARQRCCNVNQLKPSLLRKEGKAIFNLTDL